MSKNRPNHKLRTNNNKHTFKLPDATGEPVGALSKGEVTIKEDGVKITEFKGNSFIKLKWNLKRKKFEERTKIKPEILKKYQLGKGVKVRSIKGKLQQHKVKRKEQKIRQAEEETARAEILLTESEGLLEAEDGTYTSHISQRQIRDAVDITTASKSFDLNLTNFGPYKFRYTKNGRHIVLGGKLGHLAAFDWITKRLHFEINVGESIHDVCYLDNEQKMAVAQRQWVYTYDNEGIETHCLKRLDNVLKMEYLPYHCLLCTGSQSGFISWLDITLGEEILQFPTLKGPLRVMCQNPYNAVICCGHNNGTITMWTPNSRESVASVLCHAQAIQAIEVDPSGKYLATAATDKLVKLWDTRNLGTCLNSYHVGQGANNIAFSQRGLLAVSMNNMVEVYRGALSEDRCKPYMRHNGGRTVTGLQFCPYEDVLGVSSYNGFCSIVIPGSGNPNFDALEANPYISVSGRREAEVKNLLAKIPSELITLDPSSIAQVDTPSLQEKIDARSQLSYVKPPKVDVNPRYRMKGKSGSATKFKRKQKVVEEKKRAYVKDMLNKQEMVEEPTKKAKLKKSYGPALDRFLPKNI